MAFWYGARVGECKFAGERKASILRLYYTAAVSVFRLEANRDVNFHIFHWQMQTFCNPLKHTSVDIQSILEIRLDKIDLFPLQK